MVPRNAIAPNCSNLSSKSAGSIASCSAHNVRYALLKCRKCGLSVRVTTMPIAKWQCIAPRHVYTVMGASVLGFRNRWWVHELVVQFARKLTVSLPESFSARVLGFGFWEWERLEAVGGWSGGDGSGGGAQVEVRVVEIMDAGELLDALSHEVRELSLGCTGEVARIEGSPDSLRFLREFVMPNRPCIITNAIDHWPALRLWSNSYLRAQLAHHSVSCHFTPDGRADALVEATVDSDLLLHEGLGYAHGDGGQEGEIVKTGNASGLVFASALVEALPFPEALNHVLGSSCEGSVAYLQQQNNCFPLEFSALSEDADGDIGWASEALGCKPEAVNLWIGTRHSVTSFHKDHYENLYAVISGEKHFTLLPPTDVHRMYVNKYPTAHYERTVSFLAPSPWVPYWL